MEPIKWIHTPATCKECGHYDKNKRRCGVKECPYPARRGKVDTVAAVYYD